jgi:uncharacterized membrane protein
LSQAVEAHATITAAPDTVFAYLADYRCAEVFIEGLEQLTPIGSRTTGVGARFDAILKVVGRTFRTVIVIASLEPGRSITWSSVGEDNQNLTFELRPEPGGGTSISLTVSYEPPGGLSGALIAPFVARTVQQRATGTLERLQAHLPPT